MLCACCPHAHAMHMHAVPTLCTCCVHAMHVHAWSQWKKMSPYFASSSSNRKAQRRLPCVAPHSSKALVCSATYLQRAGGEGWPGLWPRPLGDGRGAGLEKGRGGERSGGERSR